jgi:hypothetical protein
MRRRARPIEGGGLVRSRIAFVVAVLAVASTLIAAVPSSGAAPRSPRPAPPGAGLTVVASADEVAVVAGATVHLHITVVNTGSQALHGVTIAEGAAPSCAAEPFDLAVGGSRTVDCAVEVDGDDVGTWSYVAEVTAVEVGDPVASNPVA